MKKLLVSMLAMSMLYAIPVMAKELTPMGKELSLKETTKVSDVLAKPADFVGKTVLIKGVVLDVCKERGCWMKVSSDKKKENIIIKVKDGDMVFPLDAKGKEVTVEGELFEVKMNKKKQEEMKKEHHKTEDYKEMKKVYMFKPAGVKFN